MTAADAARVVVERDHILSGSEFQHSAGWFERLLLPFLGKVLEWFSGLSRPAYWAVIGALCAAVVAIIVHLFYSLATESRRAGRGTAVDPQDAFVTSRGRSAADLAAAARAEIGAGRFAEAVRLAWLGAIAALDAAGVSRAVDGRADWEHVAAARRRGGPAGVEVEALAILFQRTRFGAAPVDAAAAGRCLERLDVLRSGIDAHD